MLRKFSFSEMCAFLSVQETLFFRTLHNPYFRCPIPWAWLEHFASEKAEMKWKNLQFLSSLIREPCYKVVSFSEFGLISIICFKIFGTKSEAGEDLLDDKVFAFREVRTRFELGKLEGLVNHTLRLGLLRNLCHHGFFLLLRWFYKMKARKKLQFLNTMLLLRCHELLQSEMPLTPASNLCRLSNLDISCEPGLLPTITERTASRNKSLLTVQSMRT